MWVFKACIAVGDYVIACPGMQGRAARKTRVRRPQEPDMTQRTFGQKFDFMKSHDPNNVSTAK